MQQREWSAALLATAAAVGVVAGVLSRRPRYSFAGRVALITGGSRGLGLVLARQLVREGATVMLMARDRAELARAAATISRADRVLVAQGDVRVPEDCQRVVADILAQCGRLDVLVNNAGVIVSAPFARTGNDDFQALMDVHFWGTLHMTRAALPHLRRQAGARLVNITSIGAKIPVPHLSAYCASKFAQGALSAILAEELRPQGVTVCTVYPGLMRTGSHLNARFRGDVPKEFAAFTLASGLPVVSMGAERAASLILSAVRRGQREAIVPFTVRQAARLAALAPSTTVAMLGLVNRALPGGSGGPRVEPMAPVRGEEVPLNPVIRAAAVLNERAADRNNERTTVSD
jgi:NAD(P)-dependent dehydrogenase (short-subunit alcohol dehydrogenase family)